MKVNSDFNDVMNPSFHIFCEIAMHSPVINPLSLPLSLQCAVQTVLVPD